MKGLVQARCRATTHYCTLGSRVPSVLKVANATGKAEMPQGHSRVQKRPFTVYKDRSSTITILKNPQKGG